MFFHVNSINIYKSGGSIKNIRRSIADPPKTEIKRFQNKIKSRDIIDTVTGANPLPTDNQLRSQKL